jgi:hypothetical protein
VKTVCSKQRRFHPQPSVFNNYILKDMSFSSSYAASRTPFEITFYSDNFEFVEEVTTGSGTTLAAHKQAGLKLGFSQKDCTTA